MEEVPHGRSSMELELHGRSPPELEQGEGVEKVCRSSKGLEDGMA